MQKIKHRSSWSALFIALITLGIPGVGQIFAGRLGRTFLSLAILGILFLLYAAGAMNYLYGAVPLSAAYFTSLIYVAYDSYQLNADKKGIKLHWYNKWYFYIIFTSLILFLNYSVISTSGLQSFQIMNNKFYPTLQVGDKVMTKMNSAKHLGLFPLTISSNQKYKPGSFIFFQRFNDNRMFFGKILAVGKNTFTSSTAVIHVPHGNVLVALNMKEFILIPIEHIQGKGLYIFWSKNISRIGLRVDH